MSYIVRKVIHKDSSVELSYLDMNNFWRHERQQSAFSKEQAEAVVQVLNINSVKYTSCTLNKCDDSTFYYQED